MALIDAKYEQWKNKLLDLGKRNRLINFKDTKSSTVKITSPDYASVFQRLVTEEKEIIFPMPALNATETEFDGTIETSTLNNEQERSEYLNNYAVDYPIVTDKAIAELQRVLRNLRNKAKIAIEEQGINVLYLSFGFLRYTEAPHSGIILRAPLVLVPVSLTIESISDPFKLNLHEDEITLNPTLLYYLESEFGLHIPDYADTDDLSAYFDSVDSAVQRNGWSVERSVSLSLLSFLKINMYKDLERHKDTIVNHPVVRAFAGDGSGLTVFSDGLSEYDFDKNDAPDTVFQILDADASQQEAIQLAKMGGSFVLQGPPGTGKSQTITNIIAVSLAAGKKVLFVSEKMAALEVVHRRLQASGLEDFCLVLHSHKASKRDVLDQLEQVLLLAQKKAVLSEEVGLKLHQLQYYRDSLNSYAEQLHSVVQPLHKTIYEANGAIANSEDVPDIIFPITDIDRISREDYDHIIFLLTQFAGFVSKLTGDITQNPWYGASLSAVTNEFIHDANSTLPVLAEKLRKVYSNLERINRETQIGYQITFLDLQNTISVLAKLEYSYKVPVQWASEIRPETITADIEKGVSEQIRAQASADEIIRLSSQLKLQLITEKPMLPDLLSLEKATEYHHFIDAILHGKELFSVWTNTQPDSISALLNEASDKAHEIKEIRTQLRSVYESDIFTIDYKSIRNRIRTEYTSFLKALKSSYRQDKKLLMAHRIDASSKVTFEEMTDTAEKLCQIDKDQEWFTENKEQIRRLFGSLVLDENTDYDEVKGLLDEYTLLNCICSAMDTHTRLLQEHEQNRPEYEAVFHFLYSGIATDWDHIRQAFVWSTDFQSSVTESCLGMQFVQHVFESPDYAKACYARRAELYQQFKEIEAPYNWFNACFSQENSLERIPFSVLAERAKNCNSELHKLEEWIDYRAVRSDCCRIPAIAQYIPVVEEHKIRSEMIVPVYRKRFFRLWLDAILPNYPAVQAFRASHQDATIQEFASLDRVQFGIASSRIKGQLVNDLPSMDHFTSGHDEISVLKRELRKQRKIMPIRKLFAAIPNLLPRLKPCLMMSPLSVSLFLEADSYQFDVVIFDEASQVYTENAIGAISRGKQVIIAGDSKQLPPTNFFQSTVAEGDYDQVEDDEEVYSFESILDEANMLPERTLRWHYRSRHESLIAFSNAKIYNNRLVTFPSNIEHADNVGVQYIYVPTGFYDRGGRKGNVYEAQRVAELVFEHFRNEPERSLGVIAFGEIQQNAIENCLRSMRLNDPSYESLFAEDRENAFFVKSLENVQGDERDTIIFSIGYARDAAGVFRNQFGPLGRSGGERRLNVAITRAKYNVKLVGSIMPTDIDVDRISSDGPKLLRSYIDYAMHGTEVLQREILAEEAIQNDSPFEESVFRFLENHGYRFATQVGCSGYRIDMAVKHPEMSGVYVIGIECDGASYHSARTARERDRLRQDVLERMGWKIYRIWSTDWVRNPAKEQEQLLSAIETAIQSYSTELPVKIEQNSMSKASDYISIDEVPKADIIKENPYGFEKRSSYSFSDLQRDAFGYIDAKDAIEMVVNYEFPVHFDILCQRVAGLWGNEKATVKVKREVEYHLRFMHERVKRKGDFLYPVNYNVIPIRLPNERKIQHISIDEIAEAMMRILPTYIGINRTELINETARVYGFARVGQNISSTMSEAVQFLIDHGRVVEIEGKLKLA